MKDRWKVMLCLIALCGMSGVVQPASISDNGRFPKGTRSAFSAVSEAAFGTMWTIEDPPLLYWQRVYGFVPDSAWLQHVRLSTLRLGTRCSASFVSERGLVLTNHHCVRPCINALSTDSTDYLNTGFRADSPAEEALCPGLYLDQLIGVEDLLEHRLPRPSGATDADVASAREAEVAQIEKACHARSGLICQVVSLHAGRVLRLYKYRRYETVKLVFAPELQAASFGGDRDNFTYPRYSLDVAFLRAYEADSSTPLESPQHFTVSEVDPEERELLFLVGNPRSTKRYATVSQWMFEQRVGHPFNVEMYADRIAVLTEVASHSAQAARALRGYLSDLKNSLKAYEGQLRGLRDSDLVTRRVALEREVRGVIMEDPQLRAICAEYWENMTAIATEKEALFARLNLYNPDFFVPSPHVATAAELVRYVRALAHPEAERPPALQGDRLQQAKARLAADVPLNGPYGEALLAGRLALAQHWLPADDPLLTAALRPGESAAEAAHRLIGSSAIGDVAFRTRLIEGGVRAVEVSTDPLVQLACILVDLFEPVRRRYVELLSREEDLQRQLSDVLVAAFGTTFAPDATFTLRISDGVVSGYRSGGLSLSPQTTVGGLYERSEHHGNEMPWTLPSAFAMVKTTLDRAIPLDFVTTNDMSGGSSGSPIVNRRGLLVGVAFDNNEENLASQFLFGPAGGRAIAVHAAGLIQVLRRVYGAESLLAEVLGSAN